MKKPATYSPEVIFSSWVPEESSGRPAGSAQGCLKSLVVKTRERALIVEPAIKLTGNRRILQHAGPVEIVEVVHRVCDIVGDIHHRTFDGLLVLADVRVLILDLIHLGGIKRVCREFGGAHRAVEPDTSRQLVRRVIDVASPFSSRPRIFEHRSPHCDRQVEPTFARIARVEVGQNPKRLGVAFKTVVETEKISCHTVKHLFTQMAERWMPEVVGAGCRLHHNVVATAKLRNGVPVLTATIAQRDGDGSGDSVHFERVRQPIVDHNAGAGLRNHLRDSREPREVRGETNALQIDAKSAVDTLGKLLAEFSLSDSTVQRIALHQGAIVVL